MPNGTQSAFFVQELSLDVGSAALEVFDEHAEAEIIVTADRIAAPRNLDGGLIALSTARMPRSLSLEEFVQRGLCSPRKAP